MTRICAPRNNTTFTERRDDTCKALFKNDSASEDSFTMKRLPNDVYSEYASISGVVPRLNAIAEINPR